MELFHATSLLKRERGFLLTEFRETDYQTFLLVAVPNSSDFAKPRFLQRAGFLFLRYDRSSI
jgi:hypothetical protein